MWRRDALVRGIAALPWSAIRGDLEPNMTKEGERAPHEASAAEGGALKEADRTVGGRRGTHRTGSLSNLRAPTALDSLPG